MNPFITQTTVENPDATLMAWKDWAHVTGKDSHEKAVYYVDDRTGNEYLYIAGGIAWPSKLSDKRNDLPGFAVVVGVNKESEGDALKPTFTVLWETEEKRIKTLVWECVKIRYGFGYLNCLELLRFWYGDYRRYQTETLDTARIIERVYGKNHDGFFVNPALDVEQTKCFDIYARTVQSLLTPDSSGKKRLTVGKNERLRNRLQDLTVDSPGVLAIGYVVHTLATEKPWLVNLGGRAYNLED